MRRVPDLRRLLKIALIVVLVLFGAVILLVLGTMIYDHMDRQAFKKRSPIAAMSTKEFQKRVYARFPIGSPEAELVRELTSQGFRRLEPLGKLPEEALRGPTSRKSKRRLDGKLFLGPGPGVIIVCDMRWRVVWQRDSLQKISALHAMRITWCL